MMLSGPLRRFILDPWCSNPDLRKKMHTIARMMTPGRWEPVELDGLPSRYEIGNRRGRAVIRDTVARVQWLVPDPWAFRSVILGKH